MVKLLLNQAKVKLLNDFRKVIGRLERRLCRIGEEQFPYFVIVDKWSDYANFSCLIIILLHISQHLINNGLTRPLRRTVQNWYSSFSSYIFENKLYLTILCSSMSAWCRLEFHLDEPRWRNTNLNTWGEHCIRRMRDGVSHVLFTVLKLPYLAH